MSSRRTDERISLDHGVAKLRPLFDRFGFVYSPGEDDSSSGGPFATAFFRRGNLEVGLIVRNRNALGCPNYSEGHGYAGYADLISVLGKTAEAQLVPGESLSYISKAGGDAFDALFSDLEAIILPALQDSPNDFSSAVAEAHTNAFRHMFRRST